MFFEKILLGGVLMDRNTLIDNIVDDLFYSDLLDTKDFYDYVDAKETAFDIIKKRLSDYIIISGNILE